METPKLVEKVKLTYDVMLFLSLTFLQFKVIATEEASPENTVTMEKIIKMQKKRKQEKPVKMLIKGGMLFKDGMTTEEKKVTILGFVALKYFV